MKKIIHFLRFDFWSYLNGNPKCKKGGYCNTEISRYYSKVIKGLNHSEFIYGYKYFCDKCGKNISDHFDDEYLRNLSSQIKERNKRNNSKAER